MNIPSLFLIVFSATTALPALATERGEAASPARAALVKRIERACARELRRLGPDATPPRQPARACACIGRNLDAHLSHEEFELITRSHELDARAGRELQDRKYVDLLTFDDQVVSRCLQDPDATVRPGEIEDEDEDQAP